MWQHETGWIFWIQVVLATRYQVWYDTYESYLVSFADDGHTAPAFILPHNWTII
jgi:hypothetical protein